MKLDHLVYFSRKSAAQNHRELEKAGYPVIIGGSHRQWGTQNALLYCANAYVEWLSIEKPEVAKRSTHPLTRMLVRDLRAGEGWGALCFEVDNIKEFKKVLEEKGCITSPIFPAQRQTPEGEFIKWKMLFIEKEGAQTLPFPFFIEWEKSAEKRLKALQRKGSFTEANKGIKIEQCVFQVNHPQEVCASWKTLFKLEQEESHIIKLPQGVQLVFEQGAEGEKEHLKTVTFNLPHGSIFTGG